jgi:choline dehydrogenase-like flavoprotein
MGDSADLGVVDHRCEVFGYEGLFCMDSSAIPTSLGVNPSLTISAIASSRRTTIRTCRAAENTVITFGSLGPSPVIDDDLPRSTRAHQGARPAESGRRA